ncbi:MAG: PTS transporter subunit IIC [Tissierella sp.]|uniref:PTS transporter subunit IIC n=1 Tax=Tissierella sp. TaxID=41274 RepID=UPI003F9A3532
MNQNQRGIKGYFIKVLNGMALGLFASLLIGLIIKQIGTIFDLQTLVIFGNTAQRLMGPAIGVGVAYSVGAPPLGIFASVVVGAIGAGSIIFEGSNAIINIGEPVGAFITSLIAAESSKIISGKTKVDIVLVPITAILVGGFIGKFIAPYMTGFMDYIGRFINMATELHPIPMGIIISVFMGMLLTLPISSAAIAISLKLSGIAAGASVVGCAANMIGFAVISYKENGFGGFLAQGLGTSMLQVPNIIKNPAIWIPAILSSAILGPVSTYILKMEANMAGAGMGTSGFVGQFGVIDSMGSSVDVLIMIAFMHFIMPAIISFLIYKWMYKRDFIRDGDMKL